MSAKKTAALCMMVLLLGVAVTLVVFSTEPKAERTGATRKTAMLVDVTAVERGTFRPTVVAMGTVEPAQEIDLSPRVDGEIVERATSFVPGGRVRKGEVLLRIDPADYEIALEQRQSELHRALADLEIEMGRQKVAEQDLELFDGELPPESRELVLRRPQLETARAAVEAAQAAVDRAELDLQRTRIRAPFDALVLRRDVNLGSQVAAGQSLGRLVGVDSYWVMATVPLAKLRWISFPDSSGSGGSEVWIHDDASWPENVYRKGTVHSLVGTLEGRTRLARVIISVSDPLGIESDVSDEAPLMIGAYVEARILGRELPDVVRLDRRLLRQDETVWVMEGEELRIRDLEIVLRDEDYAYVSEGLSEGDRVVTTNLATVTDGAPLRLRSDGAAAEDSVALDETDRDGVGR